MNKVSFELRLQDVTSFYAILDELEQKVGGKRTLAKCHGRMDWPKRGVYFFFENNEIRSTSGVGLRVVRVGTHALKSRGKQKLWNRLKTHQGTIGGDHPGGGNHRRSVFRLHVGTALINRDGCSEAIAETWGVGNNAPKEDREKEYPLEKAVSRHIRAMPFLWVEVDDEPGPESHRGVIERNAIKLLSNYNRPEQPIDPSSQDWLGRYATNKKIQQSGLWNVNYVDETYDPSFLVLLQFYVSQM